MSNNTENIPPQVIKKVLKEISEINNEPIEGIKLISNEQDICDIQALIDGPSGTPYEQGYFRIKLVLCKGFPSQPPKGFFTTKIFHPNVNSSNGEICVNTLKKDWKPDLGIKHILLTVKCLLIVPNAESALNEEAGKLLLEDYDEYFSRAKLYTEVHARNRPSHLFLLNHHHHHQASNDNLYTTASTSSSTLNSFLSTTTACTTQPLDSNKTISNNNVNNNSASTTSTTTTNASDEPNMKMAKMTKDINNKKNDKKKALKRL